MSVIQFIVEVLLHLDVHLAAFMSQYGASVYVLLFFLIFCETGLVVTPFLPGDSLIFAAGALCAKNIMSWWALLLFIAAAITGNMLNYQIGRSLSERVRRREKMRLIKQEYIDRTQDFFEKHGGATIIITRFMPILRTFSPFVAGVGEMPYNRFMFYNAIGGISWATAFFLIGFYFGNMSFVKDHFSIVILAIVFISLIPAVVAFIKSRSGSTNSYLKK